VSNIVKRATSARPEDTERLSLNSEQHGRTFALDAERSKLVALVASRADEALDRYADLRSQWRTRSAQEFIFRIYHDIADDEQASGRRVRRRLGRSGGRFVDALARFVGDLLRARRKTAGHLKRRYTEQNRSQGAGAAMRA